MSRFTSRPPLKAAIGVLRFSGSISIDMPRGGRPLVIAKRIPASPSLRTASTARSVRTLSGVTSVPSTSARTSLMLLSLLFKRSPRVLRLAVPPVLDQRSGRRDYDDAAYRGDRQPRRSEAGGLHQADRRRAAHAPGGRAGAVHRRGH